MLPIRDSREELEEKVQQALDEMPEELKPEEFQTAEEGGNGLKGP